MLPGLPAGAADRLLPLSLPGRFFAAAILFHLGAWGLLAWAGADALLGFTGGPGPVVAALHLLTLGTLAMTALGAGLQMVPIATQRPFAAHAAGRWLFVLYTPGVALLVAGLAQPWPLARAVGAVLTLAGLALFGLLLARHVVTAPRRGGLEAHLALALAALAGLGGLGAALVVDFSAGWLHDHAQVAAAHAVLGGYGFMGMLAVGFSHLLVPMFVLGPALPDPAVRRGAALAGLALLVGSAGALSGLGWLSAAGAALGLGAVGAHLHTLWGSIRQRLRRRFEPFIRLVLLARGAVAASQGVAQALALGAPADRLAPLWGLLLVVGWLLGFVLAILQRILPFLAALHSSAQGRPPALPSRLASARAADLHLAGHAAALLLLAVGLAGGWGIAVTLGLWAGLFGAAAFAVYAVLVARRLSLHRAAHPPLQNKEGPR